LFSFPLVVGGAYVSGSCGALWGIVISMAVNCLLNHYELRSELKRMGICFRYQRNSNEWSILWHFSLPAMLCGLMVGPINWLCTTILVNQPNGYAEMGIYNAVNQWRTAILFLPGTLSAIVLPMLTNLHSNNEKSRYNKLLKYNIILNGGIAIIITVIVALFATTIMKCYGTEFVSGSFVLITLTTSTVFQSIGSIIGSAIVSTGRIWYGFWFNALWAVTLCGSSYVFIPKFGALGLALATLIAYAFHLAWQSYYLKYKHSKFYLPIGARN